jgi:heat-inducible transcriptional repressor
MLQDTTRLLSNLTDAAAVVVGPPHEAATVRSVQVVGLTARVALLVAVLSNGVVEKRSLEFDRDVAGDRLGSATAHLARHLVGAHVGSLTAVPASGDETTDMVVTAAAAALSAGRASDLDNVFVGGTARMAGAFEAVDTVRQVLTILEQQLVVVTLLRDVIDRGLNVAIGAETGMAPLAECALVVAPYDVEGEPAGTIGVLGPTRMNYPQALAAVAVVSKRLGRRLSEG